MHTRRLFKSLTALIAGAVTLGIMGLPASADTRPVALTGGTLDIYDSSFNLLSTLSVGSSGGGGGGGGGGVTCSTSSGTATATATGGTSGTLEAHFDSDSVVDVLGGGSWYRVELAVDFPTGSYTGSGASVALSGSATSRIRSVSGPTSCTPTGGTDCTITAGNLAVTGSSSPASLPSLAGTVTTVNGGNTIGDNIATGSCGALLALNNGYADLIGVEITAS